MSSLICWFSLIFWMQIFGKQMKESQFYVHFNIIYLILSLLHYFDVYLIMYDEAFFHFKFNVHLMWSLFSCVCSEAVSPPTGWGTLLLRLIWVHQSLLALVRSSFKGPDEVVQPVLDDHAAHTGCRQRPCTAAPQTIHVCVIYIQLYH